MPTWLKELTVPLLMLAGVGAYWLDASSLSSIALAFPGALIVVILFSLAIIFFEVFRGSEAVETLARPHGDETGGLAPVLRPWSVVLLPLPLIFFWREIGALPALLVLTTGLMFILGERRWSRFFLIPAVLVVPAYLLFKFVLYVRLPELPFGGL